MRTLRGKISDHLPARLLLCVREQRETGVLKLSWQGMSKTVYAVSGEPVNAEGTSREEAPGRGGRDGSREARCAGPHEVCVRVELSVASIP